MGCAEHHCSAAIRRQQAREWAHSVRAPRQRDLANHLCVEFIANSRLWRCFPIDETCAVRKTVCAVERAASRGPLGFRPHSAASSFFRAVHLLYLDDAGSAKNPNERYLVLGGVAVYEAQAHWVTTELDKLAAQVHAAAPDAIEFHASEIFSGRTAPWDGLRKEERKEVIRNVLRILPRAYDSCCAFACAIHKDSHPNRDPMEMAFEDLCSRFDMYLNNISIGKDKQRGLIILDESSYETSLQSMAKRFRQLGTQWRVINRLADIPMFVNSKASRIVQLADHVAYATFRRYESGDASYFDIIAGRFYENQGVIHGLAHKQTTDQNCMCPACLSRRKTPA